MDFTPSKKPFVENTLREVYLIQHDLENEKRKTKMLADTLRQVIDISNIPKERITWYNVLGGRTMRKTVKRSRRGGQPVTTWSPDVVARSTRFNPGLARAEEQDWNVARRLDFGDSPAELPTVDEMRSRFAALRGTPGCAPIRKRLPSHPLDQCEGTASTHPADRERCLQPGEGQVHSVEECGPVRTGGKRRKTRKMKRTRKLKRKA